MASSLEKVSIVGSGLIGRSWAMIFASAGYSVVMHDIDQERISSALVDIEQQLEVLEKSGMIRVDLTAKEQFQRLSTTTDLAECVQGAVFVQECTPESLEMKRNVFGEIDKHASENTILSSSTSTLRPSLFTKDIQNRSNAIVCHPTNPPYYCPVVEVIPAPWTDPEVLKRTLVIMKKIGQEPMTVKKEVDGFVLNRMQYAILGECWRLVNDGVITVEDIDKVMSHGLGPRYAFMGPLETAYLNADGMYSYSKRYGDMIHRIQSGFGEPIPLKGELLDRIHGELAKLIPSERVGERRKWRDARLTALAKLKKDLDNQKQ